MLFTSADLCWVCFFFSLHLLGNSEVDTAAVDHQAVCVCVCVVSFVHHGGFLLRNLTFLLKF